MSILCHRIENNTPYDVSSDESPCGNVNTSSPVVSCCANSDFCLTDGFCAYTHSQVGGSGFYVASCTETSGICPNYPKRCTDQAHPDAVWNSTAELWQCCGQDSSGNPSCDSPTNEYFSAPARSLLQTIFSEPTAGWVATSTFIVSPSTTLASSTTTSHTLSPSATVASNSGLSTGADAGIGVGVAFASLAALSLLLYFIFRQRRRRKGQGTTYRQQGHDPSVYEMEHNSRMPAEMAHDRDPAEMANDDWRPMRNELGTSY